jgi:hypothetical protein
VYTECLEKHHGRMRDSNKINIYTSKGLWYPSSRVQTRLKPSNFSREKILSMPSFGGEVRPSVPCRRFAACKRSRHLPWKSHAVGKIGSAISRPYFLPPLIEVSHVAGRGVPLEMTGETKNGAQRARSYGLGASGLQGPASAPHSTTTTTTTTPQNKRQLHPRRSNDANELHAT